jgi:hypothetical protein
MEKISWTDHVNNEAVLHRVKEERNILHTIRRRKANWIAHILGKIIGTRRRGRRRKQLLDDLKEARRYWKLKEEAQDRTLWDLSQDRLLLELGLVNSSTLGRVQYFQAIMVTLSSNRLQLLF